MISNPDLIGDVLVALLSRKRAAIQDALRRQDAKDRFPVKTMDMLREMGVLSAPLPTSEGGFGWGTEQAGLAALCSVLQILGYGSLALGRIYEAHVNAIALIFRYGNSQVRAAATTAVRNGHLFGLWVTPGKRPVRGVQRGSHVSLSGQKAFCTAAGFATWAVITAQDEQDQEQMFLVETIAVEIDPDSGLLSHAMQSTSTKAAKFDCEVPLEHRVGTPGVYLREPDFSAGAWRTSAVTVGGLLALVEEAVRQFRARGRHTDPHQAARIGQMLIHCQTAAHWIDAVPARHQGDPKHLIGYINLARLAIERASLEVISLVQRGLGLSGLLATNPLAAMMADLALYLRQPAGDEVLTEAAIHFAETPTPTSLGLMP